MIQYYETFEDLNLNNTFTAIIDKIDLSKEDLLFLLSQKLNFPDYFGHNWDALYECLTDFNWIEKFTIKIIHFGIPLIDIKELKIYIDILYDSLKSWENDNEHSLEVYFPNKEKYKIELLINDINSIT